jgi:hypothetical protein
VAGKSSREFEVKFTGDTKNLTKSFGNLQREAGGLGKSVQKSSNLMRTALAGVSVVALTRGLQSAVMAASNLSESFAKSNTVFGNNAKQIEAWSRTTAKALGVSQQAALEAAGTYGNLFRAFGINEQESAKMSQALVVLAADLASFNNVPIEDALLALRSGLSGETEPLKRFGIAINDVRLKEQALADGLIETTKGTLPQAIKTQAAYALILKDSALAQGDVARTADGLSNQLKFLQAGLKDAQAGFGELLLPAALSVVSAFNDKLLPALKRVSEAIKLEGAGAGFRSLTGEIAFVITNLTGLAKVVRNNDILAKAKDAYNSFKSGITSVIKGIIDFGSAATAETGTFLENLVAQAAKAQDFGTKVKQLLGMGLSETAISQVLAAGADAGTKIADEIIAGGATIVDQINTLVSATASVAEELGTSAATQFYQAGITAGQALVDGVRAAIAAAGFVINLDGSLTNQRAIDQVNAAVAKAKTGKTKKARKVSKKERTAIENLASSLGVEVPAFAKGGIVTRPTLALIGEAGPEAVVPLSGRNAGMGNTYNITINAGMGTNGAQVGREIVDAIKKFEKTSGPVFASA